MDGKLWNNTLRQLPNPHILQTWEWGQVKAKFGWEPIYKVWGAQTNPDATALVLERSADIFCLGSRFRIHYVPKGPLIKDWSNQGLVKQVLDDLRNLAKQRGAIYIKIDPDVSLGVGVPGTHDEFGNPQGEKVVHSLNSYGWIYSKSQIQFRNTVVINLKPALDEILAGMKQKTRYNVRLAERKGVYIRQGLERDFELLYKMYAETSSRDGFTIREANYYYHLWDIFIKQGEDRSNSCNDPSCKPLIAEVNGEPVAAVIIFFFAGKAYYMQGMSRPTHRKKMPNYLLQWEAIMLAKSLGCDEYDLWGAPEIFNENDSMWGVYRFKEGMGGTLLRTIGAYDLILKPLSYRLYSKILPKILNVLRNRGRSQVERKLQETEDIYLEV